MTVKPALVRTKWQKSFTKLKPNSQMMCYKICLPLLRLVVLVLLVSGIVSSQTSKNDVQGPIDACSMAVRDNFGVSYFGDICSLIIKEGRSDFISWIGSVFIGTVSIGVLCLDLLV